MADQVHRKPLEVWFEFASTYSYLSVMRVEDLAIQSNISLVWRPFLLGPVFKAKGWETSPFVMDEAKGRYMWRDVERRAIKYGLPFKRPEVFPANGLAAARLMMAAHGETWSGDFARAMFRAQFEDGADISQRETLTLALTSVGVDARSWIDRSQQVSTKAALRQQSLEAMKIGVFGAPTFCVGDELFWGDDRLEDAVEWACAL